MGPLDHVGWTDLVAAQSARALEVLRRADPDAAVPSTPGWTVADLTWHLAETQWSWAAIVDRLLSDPEVLLEPPRPPDEALPAFLAAQSAALVDALRAQPPEARCWSWSARGGSVGWVARRQAHEALIHRVDAELAAGEPVADVDAAVAADGVQEVLEEMLQLPASADLRPDGQAIRVDAEDTGDVWTLRFGRWRGPSPATGAPADHDAAVLTDVAGPAQVHTSVIGRAWELDRWLWGRLDLSALQVHGDPAGAARLRAAVASD